MVVVVRKEVTVINCPGDCHVALCVFLWCYVYLCREMKLVPVESSWREVLSIQWEKYTLEPPATNVGEKYGVERFLVPVSIVGLYS